MGRLNNKTQKTSIKRRYERVNGHYWSRLCAERTSCQITYRCYYLVETLIVVVLIICVKIKFSLD